MLTRARTLGGAAYVFAWAVLIFALSISCIFLLSQAVRTSSRRSWTNNINVLIIIIAYSVVIAVSIAFCLKRRIAVFRRLQRISKGHMAIGKGEVPKPVHEYISMEYARACLIAWESMPKDTVQEGWGRPGTRYANVNFRRALLDTVPDIDALAHLIIPSLPRMRPSARMLHHLRYIAPLLPADEDGLSALHYYDSAVQLARHAEREPTVKEFRIGIEAAGEIKRILEECRMEMLEGSSTSLLDRTLPTER